MLKVQNPRKSIFFPIEEENFEFEVKNWPKKISKNGLKVSQRIYQNVSQNFQSEEKLFLSFLKQKMGKNFKYSREKIAQIF